MPTASDRAHSPIGPDEAELLFADLADFKSLVVAVSGGADSLALLVLLAEWRRSPDNKPALLAVTVDHKLRPEAADEALVVRQVCDDLGIPHRIVTWDEPKPSSNVQAKARTARCNLLEQVACESGASAIVLAHHLDDQAETFLYRLARGSGVYGLAGMSRVRTDTEPMLLRPLLEVPKARLEATLRAKALSWVEDPSNLDPHYERVRIRQSMAMLGELGLTAEKLADTARRLGRARSALDAWVARFFREKCEMHPAGPVRLPRGALSELPEEVGLRLLARVIRLVGGGDYTPRLNKIERLYTKVIDLSFASGGATLGGVRVHLRRTDAFLFRELGRNPPDALSLPETGVGHWDNRFLFETRKVPAGSVIQPLGVGGFAAFGLQPPQEWPKSAFASAPLVVIPGQMPYIPVVDEPGGVISGLRGPSCPTCVVKLLHTGLS